MTYTYALLEVSEPTYEEIRAKLIEAEHRHAIHNDDEREKIDMHGIALVKKDLNEGIVVWVQSLISHRTQKPRVELRIGPVRTQIPADSALDIASNIIQCVAGSHADAFIYNFMKEKVGLDDARAVAVIQEFRTYRDGLAADFQSEQKR